MFCIRPIQLRNSLKIERSTTVKRSLLLGAGGFLAVTASGRCGYPGAGPLACIISAFVAATGWRKRSANRYRNDHAVSINGGGVDEEEPVAKVFECAWVGLQPVLFAFIGTDLKLELLRSGNVMLLGLSVLLFGLVVSVAKQVRMGGFARSDSDPRHGRENTFHTLFLYDLKKIN